MGPDPRDSLLPDDSRSSLTGSVTLARHELADRNNRQGCAGRQSDQQHHPGFTTDHRRRTQRRLGGDGFGSVIGRVANPTLQTDTNFHVNSRLVVRLNGTLQPQVQFAGNSDNSPAKIVERINATAQGYKAIIVPNAGNDYVRLIANDPTHSLEIDDSSTYQLLIALGFSLPYAHPKHSEGLAADFSTSGWSLNDYRNWIRALEAHAFPGVTLAHVLAPSQAIADAINQNRLVPLAFVDATLGTALHVEINPPPAINNVEPDPIVDQDIKNAFQEVFDWLDKLIDVELDKQLPALVEAKPDNAAGNSGQPNSDDEKTPATISDALSLKSLLKSSSSSTGKKSYLDIVNEFISADVYQLASEFKRTEVDFFLNLPISGHPAAITFNPVNESSTADAFSYRYRAPINIFRFVGQRT